jgi:N-acetylneuraminic acid mutarotase
MNWESSEAPILRPRSHHSCVFAKDCLYLFAGYDGENYLFDVKKYNITQNEWKDITPPNSAIHARCGHSGLLCHDKMIIFGGYSGTHHNDVLSFNIEKEDWENEYLVGDYQPTKRWCHSAVMDELHHFMYIFGGFGECKEGKTRLYLNDTHKYDIHQRIWHPVPTIGTIPKRNNHTSVIYDGKMLVFAGSKLNDLWSLDFRNNTWTQIQTSSIQDNQPGNVYGHTACVKGNQMYIFGGRFETYQNEMYRYNLDTGKWTKMKTDGQKPTKRRNHSAVMNPFTNQMYVIGGYSGKYLNEFSVLKLNIVPTKLRISQALEYQHFTDIDIVLQ